MCLNTAPTLTNAALSYTCLPHESQLRPAKFQSQDQSRFADNFLEGEAMSSTSGIQQLSNNGLLPSSLSQTVLNGASSRQLNQLAGSSVALQQAGSLLGFTTSSSSGDSVTLSSTASNALLQEINPSTTKTASSSTDPLTQAVNNELTSRLNAAVSKFLPQSSATTGSQINLLA
jgi:hypothetical protein